MVDPIAYSEEKRISFKKKADHNKREALFCFVSILVCSLSAPLFITLAEEKFLAKIVPAVLSVLSAGFTSWLQLRKPQKLWSVYRNAERLIENEITKYTYAIGDYEVKDSPQNILVERISNIYIDTHNEWVTTVPNPESVPTPTKSIT